MNDNQEKLQKYLASAEDKAVGITEYGTMTIPYAPAEDKMLDLTPLALTKNRGPLKDQHWQNPREGHHLADRYLKMVGYRHPDGTPCKAKDPANCPYNKQMAGGAKENQASEVKKDSFGLPYMPDTSKMSKQEITDWVSKNWCRSNLNRTLDDLNERAERLYEMHTNKEGEYEEQRELPEIEGATGMNMDYFMNKVVSEFTKKSMIKNGHPWPPKY